MKKIYSIILSMVLLIGSMPMSVFASNYATTNQNGGGTGDNIIILQAKTSGKNTIKLSWNKIQGSNKYVVYGNACGKKMKKNCFFEKQ